MSTRSAAQKKWKALDVSPDAIVLTNQSGEITYFNNQAEQMFGYSRTEVLDKQVEVLIPPACRSVHMAHRKQYEGSPRSYCIEKMREVTAVRKDGLELPVDILLRPVSMDDGMMVCASIRDANQRLEREEEIQANEARIRAILETMNEGFFEVNQDFHFMYINSRFSLMLGYTSKEMLGRPLLDFIYYDDKDLMEEQLRLRKEGSGERFELSFLSKSGERIYTFTSPKAVFDEDQNFLGCFGIVTDLTDLKQSEFARMASEARYRIMVETIPYGIQEMGLDGRITYSNKAYNSMHGYDKDELLGNAVWDIASNDGECERIRNYYADVIENRPAPDPFFTQDKTKNGNVIDVQVDWDYQYNKLGHLTGFVSVITDISDRKKAEEGLKLASLVFQNSGEGMVVTDADNQIIAVNPAYSNITGYSFDEVWGKNPRIHKSGRHDRAFYKAMWHELITTGYWQGEVWDKRKNGEIYAKWLIINTIHNKDGSIHRYVALFSDITEKKQTEALIWRQANFDSLTGLPNRNMFRDRLAQEVLKSKRAGLSLALLLIDLDHFKEVNDTLGHDVGDTLLQDAARRISGCVRDSDTVARLGGDEFVIILSALPNKSNVEDIANTIINKLAEVYHLDNELVHVSASIGITLFPDDAMDIEVLMKNADQAMYAAKKKGRNRFSYFTQSLQDSARTRLRLANDLRSALVANEFRVYFQPIMDLVSGHVCKAEALLRWQHPQRGMIGPMEFIPLAEETGLINDIGDWVFRESIRWAKKWSNQFNKDFKISVNMSPIQFRVDRQNFAVEWLRQLQELELSGEHIIVEITEGLLLKAEFDIKRKLLSLRDAGIQVAIDDFGTGYSSLSYIKKFNIDYLKIDQTFVRNLETDTNDIAISEAIIVMAHKLGLEVIAEGVETKGQQALLVDAGCDYIQGYLHSRPVSPENLEALLRTM